MFIPIGQMERILNEILQAADKIGLINIFFSDIAEEIVQIGF